MATPGRTTRPAAAAENWDEDFDFPDSPAIDRARPPASPPRAPFPRAVVANATAGPSTPSRARRLEELAHENWDDDFVDRDSFPSPPRAPGGGSSARRRARSAAQNTPPPHRAPRRTGSYAPPSPTHQENWDAEFGLRPPKVSTGAASWSSSDDDDAERELGVLTPSKADEEDRTLTQRHKRVPVPIKLDTPPPVPPLPVGYPAPPRSPLVPRAPSSLSTRSDLRMTTGGHKSPAESAFSGGSGRESSLGGHTVNTYSSTTGLGLRHTLTGTSSRPYLASHALAFPPTPPQPRERRRLRKKRDRDDVVELRDMEGKAVLRKRRPLARSDDVFDPARRQSIEEEPEGMSDDLPDSDLHDEAPDFDVAMDRPQTPEMPPSRAMSPPSTVHTPGPPGGTASSPPGRTPLLARIGSVTRWGVRKKRASTAPSDSSPTGLAMDLTPRPPSSAACVAPLPPPSPGGKGWFRSSTTDLARHDSASNLRHKPTAPGSPSRRKGMSMPPILGLIGRTASSGTDDVPLDELTLPSQLGFVPPVPPLPESHVSRISRRLSALPLPGRAQKKRNSSFGGSSVHSSSLSVNRVGMQGPPSGEPTPRRPSRSRSRARGIVSPSQDSLPGQLKRSLDRKRKSRQSAEGEDDAPEPGSGKLMARVRRLSFKKQHRSSHSLVAPDLPASFSLPLSPRIEEPDGPPVIPPVSDLLPPIELQPPSPPQTRAEHPASPIESSLSPVRDGARSPASPLAASLGRATQSPPRPRELDSPAQRRSSLGDLKIPARISQAQVGLRMNLGMVREFAASVDRLRELQTTYYSLIRDIQAVLNTPPSAPSSTTSPNFATPRRPSSRARSSTNPIASGPSHAQLASALHVVAAKYRIAWECAELLIELAGGPPAETKPLPISSMSEPLVVTTNTVGMPPGHIRERTMTLESVDRPDPAWRGSSGRNDLSRRQLLLLRDMLQGTEALGAATPPADGQPRAEQDRPPSVNRAWRWGDPMSSTITLPSEENAEMTGSPLRKRQSGVKLGMRGLRDMLRGLKKSQQVVAPPMMEKSSSTGSSQGGGPSHQALAPPPRSKSKASSAAQSMRSANLPPPAPSEHMGPIPATLGHKPSPRRPSLASIFRLGQRQRSGAGPPRTPSSDVVVSIAAVAAASRTVSGSSRQSSTSSEEDWDRIDSASDIDATASLGIRVEGAGTVRVPSAARRSPYTQQGRNSGDRSPTTRRPPVPAASRSSIFTDAASGHSHNRKLSNVEEQVDALGSQAIARRASVRSNRGGSMRVPPAAPVQPMSIRARSAPQTQAPSPAPALQLPDPQLAMTPENIRPLLENAREVQQRLTECVEEVRGLLGARS